MYANIESIFNELEQEVVNLYDLNYQLILNKVREKVIEYMAIMDDDAGGEPELNLGTEADQMEGSETYDEPVKI